MFRFTLDVAGERVLDRGIARFADGVTDYRPIWNVIADDFYAQMEAQFKSEGEEGGERWQELSPAYADWKEVHFPGKPILERTGDLVASLTKQGDPHHVRKEERKRLTLGSSVPYGIYHQSPAPRKKLPRRPPVMLPERFKRQVMHHIQVYLVQIASASGFRHGLGPLESSKLSRIFGGKGFAPRGTSPRRSSESGILLF